MEARIAYQEKLQNKKSIITQSIEEFTKTDANNSETKPPQKEKDPSFIVINATSEAIAQKMSENGGCVFSLCAEARSLLAIVSGLYRKEGVDTEIYNSGWSGESIRQDRISRGVSEILRPCLSILWLVQYDDFRKNKGFQKIHATQEASEVFRKFHNEQVELMNNELKSVQELFGKARENAVRLAIIFAIADGTEVIDERIAENACKVIKYSLYNAVEFYTSGLLLSIEQRRIKMENILRKKNGRVRISYFQQFAKIFPDEITNIVATFPELYALHKENNGTYVLLKEVYPDTPTKESPDEEILDDDYIL